jgi:ubiquinone/menaquinone biosynthesis C-methylase UbiE
VSAVRFRPQPFFPAQIPGPAVSNLRPMKYDWKDAGEEWSERWGTSEAQWSGTILPRIKKYLPASTILEIGPGYGRWTHYLKDHCDRLLIVDRAAQCIDACRERFAAEPKITGYVNKSGSLAMIPDRTVDFVFSFDVFVHIPRPVAEEYLAEFSRTLKPGGKGFVHHSNLGVFENSPRNRLPAALKKLFTQWHILDEDHHRTPTMSAEIFRSLCPRFGLHCTRQELVNWRGRRLIDCFSWFERTETANDGKPTEVIRNPNFMREADAVRRGTEKKS